MTVRHKLASLDDEQTRDLLLQVARGQEDRTDDLPLTRRAVAGRARAGGDALPTLADAGADAGHVYGRGGRRGVRRGVHDARRGRRKPAQHGWLRNYSDVESQESHEQTSDTVTVCVTLVTTPGKSRQPRQRHTAPEDMIPSGHNRIPKRYTQRRHLRCNREAKGHHRLFDRNAARTPT